MTKTILYLAVMGAFVAGMMFSNGTVIADELSGRLIQNQQTIHDNQYETFFVRGGSGTCVDSTASALDTDNLFINSLQNKDFMVTSITILLTGVDHPNDFLRLNNMLVDGNGFGVFTEDYTGAEASFTYGFEVLGGQRTGGAATIPYTLVSNGNTLDNDIHLFVLCRQDSVGGNPIIFASVTASGFKRIGDTIQITHSE